MERKEEYTIVQRDDSSWLIDGQYPIIEFNKQFDVMLEKDYKNKFVTVAGLFIEKFGSLPNIGDRISISDYEMEVIDKDGQRIDKILISKT
jgi:putative hemolysin